jgi:hypothetical protein
MKVIVNAPTNMNTNNSIERNMTMTINMKIHMNNNMKEQEFAHGLGNECEEECQIEDEGEVECDAANGNQMLLNCMIPRRPNHSRGGRGRYPTRLPKISRAEMQSPLFRK